MRSLSRSAEGLAAGAPASSYHRGEGCQLVGLIRRFVDANAADAGEAHRQTGLVPGARVDRIEGDLQHQALLDLAHRSEALDRVTADPAIEPFQLLVGEAEIGLPDGEQLAAFRPAAERIVAVIARSLSR